MIEGAIIELSADKLKTKTFDGQNGQVIFIDMMDVKIGFIGMSAPRQDQNQPATQSQPPRQNQSAPPQQAPLKPPAGGQGFDNSFDDSDLPF